MWPVTRSAYLACRRWARRPPSGSLSIIETRLRTRWSSEPIACVWSLEEASSKRLAMSGDETQCRRDADLSTQQTDRHVEQSSAEPKKSSAGDGKPQVARTDSRGSAMRVGLMSAGRATGGCLSRRAGPVHCQRAQFRWSPGGRTSAKFHSMCQKKVWLAAAYPLSPSGHPSMPCNSRFWADRCMADVHRLLREGLC